MFISRPRFSYRDDAAVPEFDDTGPITFMDGNCVLCSMGARLLLRLDRRREFRICPIQTPLGRAMLAHHGLDPNDPESWLYLEAGVATTSLDAMIGVGRRVGGVGHLMRAFKVLPRGARDWLYLRLARNRYHLFGRTDLCAIPDPDLRARLIG